MSISFRHPVSISSDIRMQRVVRTLGMEGVGVYWTIMEALCRDDGRLALESISDLAYSMHVKEELVRELVLGSGLFEFDEDGFWSRELSEDLQQTKEEIERKERLKKRAKKAASSRWEGVQTISDSANPDMLDSCISNAQASNKHMLKQCISNAQASNKHMLKQCISNAQASNKHMLKQCISNAQASNKHMLKQCISNAQASNKHMLKQCISNAQASNKHMLKQCISNAQASTSICLSMEQASEEESSPPISDSASPELPDSCPDDDGATMQSGMRRAPREKEEKEAPPMSPLSSPSDSPFSPPYNPPSEKEEREGTPVNAPTAEQKKTANMIPLDSLLLLKVPEGYREAFREFLAFRKQVKKQMTPHAVDLAVAKLDRDLQTDKQRQECLRMSILNGWLGVFPNALLRQRDGPKANPSGFRQRTKTGFDYWGDAPKEDADGIQDGC